MVTKSRRSGEGRLAPKYWGCHVVEWEIYLSCLLGLSGHQESFFHRDHPTSNCMYVACISRMYFIPWIFLCMVSVVTNVWLGEVFSSKPVYDSMSCLIPKFQYQDGRNQGLCTPETLLSIRLILFKAWLVFAAPGVSRNWVRSMSCVHLEVLMLVAHTPGHQTFMVQDTA